MTMGKVKLIKKGISMISKKDFTIFILLHTLTAILIGAAIMGTILSVQWAYFLALASLPILEINRRLFGSKVFSCVIGYEKKLN